MPDDSEDVRMVTSMARFDRDLTLVDFGDDWAKIISRVAKIPMERIAPGASLPEIAGDESRGWIVRYRDALEGQSDYSRVALRGEAGGGPLGATATSWDLYALPITLDEQIVGVIELAVRADRTVEAAVLASLPDMCFVLDPEGIVAGCHGSSLSDIFGGPDKLIGRPFTEIAPEAERRRIRAALDDVARGAHAGDETRQTVGGDSGIETAASLEFVVGRGVSAQVFEARFAPLPSGGTIVVVRDVTEAKRALAIQSGQNRFLELLAKGGGFEETLTSLIRILEEQSPGMSGLILLLDADGRRLRIGASATLPREYVDSLDGLVIGPAVGSCGTAAFTGERVIAEDIMTDKRWDGLRDLAAKYGLRACWSQPVVDDDGIVMGTFAMYYRTPRTPLPVELRAIETAARLVRVAIEQRHAREEVEAAYEQLERRIEERTREIERRRRVAEGLREILGSLNSARPLEDILDLILEQAEEFLGAEAGALYRLDRGGDTLDVAAARGLAEAGSGPIAVGEGVVGWAVMAGRPVVVSGVGTSGIPNGNRRPANRTSVGRGRAGRGNAARCGQPETRLDRAQWDELPDWALGRFRSLMAVPLVGKDRVYGVIALCFSESRGFSHEELKLAMSFGDQAALAIENAELRAKAEESAAAAERSRLARDLHDAVTQTLFSASLIAEVLPRLWKQNEEDGLRRLDELRRLTRGALAEMRSLLLELRPATLMEVGLEELLRQLAEAMMGRAGIPVHVELSGAACAGTCALPPQVRVGLYRIAQESLSNVAKHSGAREAWVSLTCSEDEPGAIRIQLRVRDNGRGFDQDIVSPEHLGLRIMQERAAAIGARILVTSSVGQGTEIVVAWSSLRGGEGS